MSDMRAGPIAIRYSPPSVAAASFCAARGAGFTCLVPNNSSGVSAGADFAEGDRGHEWHHSIVPGWEGTIHLVPNGVWSPDSPDFRAVITRGLPPARPHRGSRRNA